jgi:hypothetical protein
MRADYKKMVSMVMIVGLAVFSLCSLSLSEARAAEEAPSIETLTEGKVKTGDRIDKSNVELVREYMSEGLLTLVEKGMVMKMGRQPSPSEVIPKFFQEATERNQGQAVIDEHKSVYLKDGSLWPGGIPFPEPKDGEEVMANVKYGNIWDDYQLHPMKLAFINKNGKAYKTAQMHIFNLHTTGRLKVEPLGAIPGEEKVIWKSLAVFKGPLDLKGLGQLTIRHYDEAEHEDTGFAYLPAFKRIVRVSATTYQDNVGGSDMTWGDPEGLREPFVNWRFKNLGVKYAFCSALEQRAPFLDSKCMPLPHAEFAEGVRFPVAEWAVTPMHIIEATPQIPHIYSKKVLHILAAPYWSMGGQACVNDIYDRQGILWKQATTQPPNGSSLRYKVGSRR